MILLSFSPKFLPKAPSSKPLPTALLFPLLFLTFFIRSRLSDGERCGVGKRSLNARHNDDDDVAEEV